MLIHWDCVLHDELHRLAGMGSLLKDVPQGIHSYSFGKHAAPQRLQA
jgi:hypothetical protein